MANYSDKFDESFAAHLPMPEKGEYIWPQTNNARGNAMALYRIIVTYNRHGLGPISSSALVVWPAV
ncbi:hypothetical protein GLOTRDRAFT_98914 [Gloeophyllum trabeum ATCC 11539]|uniref:Uncharacterized protein n=1 Tax=Gloeophyllum trabeum (strain ATCC 11539 / FP-39264 / Madison 617) TaxID=670483 RepID=S7QES0_GLOTA|nr:uncharacterized protein GLOTRDRAFT_98914 [Gloeophyllum trabeum ATCC 11539]EPQ58316.1 hypothetical protein GLOTRDRAFT_98914 [Gloeophyllum trabeum ATCC 11539]